MSREKPKKGKRIKHRAALNDFLALGQDRSLDKLHDWYTKNVSKPPGRSIIGIWSTRYGWQTRATEHDERVAGGVSQKVEEAAVEKGWDTVTALTDLAKKALDKAIAGFDGGKITADDAYQVQALLNSAIIALKHVELLSGRATGRLGQEDIKQYAPEWLRERLTTPPPAPPPTTAATSNETEVPENATRH